MNHKIFQRIFLKCIILGAAFFGLMVTPSGPLQLSLNNIIHFPVLYAKGATVQTFNTILPIESLGPPFSDPLFVPCAEGGAGDVVVFTGPVHFMVHQTVNPAGRVNFSLTVNDIDVVGTGTSGQEYTGHGATHFTSNMATSGPVTFTLVGQFVDRSADVRVRLSLRGHATFTPDGDPTVIFNSLSVDCAVR